MELSRRDLIKLGVLGSAALYLPLERQVRAKDFVSASQLPKPFTHAFRRPPDIDLRASANGGRAVNRLDMTMRQVDVNLLGPSPWPATPVWAYTGPRGEVNPTIHVDKGEPLDIRHTNGLPGRHPKAGYTALTSVHLHGSASLPQYDGYASDVSAPGQSKTYRYPNQQGARTLWYHDHGVHRTSDNVYAGLVGQYQLHDDMEADSGLPTGQFDIPLIIRDVMFAKDGSLIFDDNSESSLMGDVNLVNDVPWPRMPVHKRRYRFRILNAAISRSYHLALSDARAEMWVVATDGGFLPKPVRTSTLRVGMAERYEVVIDFTRCSDGAEVVMRSREVPNNVDYLHTNKVMRFDVIAGRAPDLSRNEIPSSFYTPRPPLPGTRYTGPDEIMGLTADMAVKKRRMRFERKSGVWVIDGDTWSDVVRSDYRRVVADPGLNDIELWEFENKSGGWFHPIHVHLIDFKLLKRTNRRLQAYELGPKDVAYIGEGETVTMVAKFGPHEGRYMIHCHNLVHEDHDMMVQYRVGPDRDDDPYDPIKADPPR